MQSSEREEAGSEHTLRASWGPDLEDTGPGGDHMGAEQEPKPGPRVWQDLEAWRKAAIPS